MRVAFVSSAVLGSDSCESLPSRNAIRSSRARVYLDYDLVKTIECLGENLCLPCIVIAFKVKRRLVTFDASFPAICTIRILIVTLQNISCFIQLVYDLRQKEASTTYFLLAVFTTRTSCPSTLARVVLGARWRGGR